MDDYVIVVINGVEYYVPSNLVGYISEDGVSTYSSNFYGYKNIDSALTGTNYPRIQFRTYGYPLLQTANNNTQVLTNAVVQFTPHAQFVRFTESSNYYSFFLLVLIALFVMFRRFK